MEWTTDELPELTSPYLTSIKLDNKFFNYVAWFNSEERTWFKVDFFNNSEPNILDPIEGKVVAWANPPGHLGENKMV